jgi:hypothetical protein
MSPCGTNTCQCSQQMKGYCWRIHFDPKADVSARDVPGSSGFKEAVDGVKFTALRSSPTVSERFMRGWRNCLQQCRNVGKCLSSCHLNKHNLINSLRASLNERTLPGDDVLKTLPPKISPFLQEGLQCGRRSQWGGLPGISMPAPTVGGPRWTGTTWRRLRCSWRVLRGMPRRRAISRWGRPGSRGVRRCSSSTSRRLGASASAAFEDIRLADLPEPHPPIG